MKLAAVQRLETGAAFLRISGFLHSAQLPLRRYTTADGLVTMAFLSIESTHSEPSVKVITVLGDDDPEPQVPARGSYLST